MLSRPRAPAVAIDVGAGQRQQRRAAWERFRCQPVWERRR